MRLTDKTDKWSMGNRRYEGKKNGYKVAIIFSAKSWADENEYWFYTLTNENYSYNCLWDKLKYQSQEECLAACETKINSLTK